MARPRSALAHKKVRDAAVRLFSEQGFDATSMEALIGRLERVLVAMAADPTRRLSSIDLVDAAEHSRLDDDGTLRSHDGRRWRTPLGKNRRNGHVCHACRHTREAGDWHRHEERWFDVRGRRWRRRR